jgi:hypothetical protein
VIKHQKQEGTVTSKGGLDLAKIDGFAGVRKSREGMENGIEMGMWRGGWMSGGGEKGVMNKENKVIVQGP